MLTGLNIKRLTPHLKLLVTLAILALGVVLPQLEETNLIAHDTRYFVSEDQNLSILEAIAMSESFWRPNREAPWSVLFRRSATAWSRVNLPADTTRHATELVATINLPIHRNIDYYLVKNNRVVASSDPMMQNYALRAIEPGIFRFLANDEPTQLYVRSTIAGRRAPNPRIMTAEQFAAEQTRVQFFIGMILGLMSAVCIFNLVVGLTLSNPIQLVMATTFFGLTGAVAIFFGTAERLLPSLAENPVLYSSFYYVFLAIWLLGFVLSNQSTRAEVKIRGSITFFTGSLALGLIPNLFGYHSHYVSAAILGVLAIVIIRKSSQGQPLSSHVRRLFTTAGVSVCVASVSTVLAVADVISPGIIWMFLSHLIMQYSGTKFFNIDKLGASELGLLQNAIRNGIKNKSRNSERKLSAKSDGTTESLFAPEQHQLVTMFVDIASFSKLAAPLPSSVVFQHLSQRLQEITDIIKEFGGSIDRSLGDGLLCFFGYRSQQSAAYNIQRAFLAARKIQESTVSSALNMDPHRQNHLIMPVRIGIHSSELILGNLGGSTRIDFTMIGAGVNFASRLETACAPFKVMFSEFCYNQLIALGYHEGDFSQVALHIKHSPDLVQAYEYDPFRQRQAELRIAESRYFHQLGIQMAEKRYKILHLGDVVLKSFNEEFTVHDISVHGFRVVAKQQFGRNSRLKVEVKMPDAELVELLREKFVNHLTVEVRWSQQSMLHQGLFEHGFKIIGSSDQQCNFLFQLVADRYAESRPAGVDQNQAMSA